MEVKPYFSIQDIGQANVDTIAKDPFFTYGWFRTLETQKSYSLTPLYLTASSNDTIQAIIPCFIRENSHPLFLPLKLGDKIGVFQNSRLTVGSSLCRYTKVIFREKTDKNMALALLSNQIDSFCSSNRILVSYFPFVFENDIALMTTLPQCGYMKSHGATSYHIDIRFSDFEDYLSGLESKNRKNIRREIKKCQQNGIKIQETSISHYSKDFERLYYNLATKYDKKAKMTIDSYLLNLLNNHVGDKSKAFVAIKDEKVIGFSILVEHAGVLAVWLTGYNYNLQSKTDFAYFNLCYYAPIKYAIDSGIKRINFSSSCDEVKLARGCKAEQTYFFAKAHKKILNPFMRTALELRSHLA
jgi:predicted N-acyltransferase